MIYLKKLYTENQYEIYSVFLEQIANEDDLVKNMSIYSDMKNWISSHNLSEKAINQMDDRILKEDSGDIPRLKRIK